MSHIRRSRGFTLLEMMVVVIMVTIISSATFIYAQHREGQSTIGATAVIDAAMEQAVGLAKTDPTGATLAIDQDPGHPGIFRARVFVGTPKNVGDKLVLAGTKEIPISITGSAKKPITTPGYSNLYPTEWKSGPTGIIDIFVSHYGDTDFAEGWDPASAATATYPGCATKTEIQLAMRPASASDPTEGQFGSMRLACGSTEFRQYNAKNDLIPRPTPIHT